MAYENDFWMLKTVLRVLNVLSRGTKGRLNSCRSSLVMGRGIQMGRTFPAMKEQKDALNYSSCSSFINQLEIGLILYEVKYLQITKTSNLNMSYQPLEKNDEGQKQIAKHRNPVYPGLKYPQPQPTHTLQSEITSSLFFQQLIYYNYYYAFLFFYLYSASQVHRLLYFNMEYGVPVRIIVQVIFLVIQIFRLHNAFHGNLHQSFPEICAFIMMTFLTIAAQAILLSTMAPQSPLEWTLLFYGIIFHILELLVCICTMGKLTQTQKALFLWRTPSTHSGKK